jgi:DNA-binding transcriptional ArsR family regulator
VTTATSSRELAHPEIGEIRLERVLHALSDPIRMRMVSDLNAAERGMPCAAFDLPVTKSTATHHFRVLRESGVIRQVYRGTAKVSVLRRDDLGKLFPGLLDAMLDAAELQAGRLGDG